MRSRDKKQINVTVGENIRKYREQTGYTRERFAELVGITPRFVADAENGFVGVSLTNLKRICEILGVSADRLLWENDSELELTEKVSHIDKKYVPALEQVVQKQLEIIALATLEENEKKTRK